VGVYAVAGCGADLLINILLTILGYVFTALFATNSCAVLKLTARNRYIPGHIHAFYVEYVYYERKEQAREGRFTAARAPGVYSERVQSGGQGYGTIVQPI
jgi:uncharacterized membrane protein YqaE (UPF0057 family)